VNKVTKRKEAMIKGNIELNVSDHTSRA